MTTRIRPTTARILAKRPAPEEPPGRAHRLEHAAGGRSGRARRHSRGPSRSAATRPRTGRACPWGRARRRSARRRGSRTATFSLFGLGLGLVQEGDHDRLRARLVDVDLERVANFGGEALGDAGVNQVLARPDHHLAEPGQLADQVGRCSTTSWPLTASTIVRPEIFMATLIRSQPTSRLPSLTTA